MPETSPQLDAILTDRYRIERQIGQGGMATVYLADDLKLERKVALKVLKPELGAVLGTERFLAEVKITARLDHPHIVTLIDSGVAGGLFYYVLPFVRGESLRDLLNREHQLGVEQALTITKHIASALDYAHRQGVVHRDIKPENILLQEGEALLADFGIALAVKEASDNRLTETGLSLGTPSYMSPEQATGDRRIDARSDIYSLAAVLYEMLVGEPPLTGKTAQAVVAKLLTEQPTRIRVVRSAVSEELDTAVFRALSKVPADRHATAGDFMRALEATGTGAFASAAPVKPKMSNKKVLGFAAAGVAVLALAATLVTKSQASRAFNVSAALRDRTQLTFTGNITGPALSGDGKQLAYFTEHCTGADCTYAIEVQDVGSTTTRKILEGVTAGYGLEWSPDRRNLIMNGTINAHYGMYLVSALGGPPRYLTAGPATFFAGGDSLLIGPAGASDSGFVVHVAGLGGGVRDSIKIPGAGASLATLLSVPGTSRIVAMMIQSPRGFWQVLDRTGKVTASVLNACTCGGVAAHDALWMSRAGPTAAEAVVRVALDPNTGELATHQDTIYSGQFTGFSVTADGQQIAVDDGSFTHSVMAAPLADVLRGAFPPGAPLMQGSSALSATISPDGKRLIRQRSLPGVGGKEEVHVSVSPLSGGAETPLNAAGSPFGAYWADSVTAVIGTRTPAGTQLTAIDVRTGAPGRTMTLADSSTAGSVLLSNGWAWLPRKRDRVIVEQDGKRSEIPKPAWFAAIQTLRKSDDGSKLLITGWGASTGDTVGVYVVPTTGGPAVRWYAGFAEFADAKWLAEGSILAEYWSGPQTLSLFKLTGPGQVQPLGKVPHVATSISVSTDLKQATLQWRQYRGDAWMYRVVKP